MIHQYLVEFRVCGSPKGLAKSLIYGLYRKFRVRENLRTNPVPHVTLYGPFRTRNITHVKKTIAEVARNFEPFPYTITKFGSFDKKTGWFSKKKNVVYMKVNSTREMRKFRSKLYKKLAKISVPKDPKIEEADPFQFHVTLALKDIDRKFSSIWNYLSKVDLHTGGTFSGITILHNGKILCEYDLQRGVMLGRAQALRRRCTSY